MQALQSRSCLRAKPFTAVSRDVSIRHATPVRTAVKQSVRTRATDQQIADLEAEDDSILSFSSGDDASSSLLPTEKVKLRIRMRGYDVGILHEASTQVVDIAEATGASVAGPVHLPTKKRVYCVLRSPHVNKDSREHFEIRTHNRLVDLSNLSAQTVQAMMEWVPPSGLEVECSIV